MFGLPHNRTLGMSGQSSGSRQVQVELQGRRRATVQGTQDGQTPLDA